MTTSRERKNAINYAREFLRDLLDPKKTPRVPMAIRKEARWKLKHYPSEFDVELIAKKCKHLLGDDQ